MKKALILLLCLLLAIPPALAEDAAADLQARFGGQASFTHDGTSYAAKKRASTLLLAAQEDGNLLLAYIIVVDDDLDRIAAISLPPETVIPAMGGKTLAQIYSEAPPAQDAASRAENGSIALLDAVNALLPEALVESRLVLDAQGLDLLDGGASADPALSGANQIKSRLKAIYRAAEGLSSSAQMDMFDSLSPYLATDIKTGAMMKIADKAGRYDVPPTQMLPGSMQPYGETEAFIPDEDALLSLAIEYFYEVSPW